MKIIEDYEVMNKYHKGFPRKKITEAVIHHTAGATTWRSLKKWMLSGERKNQYKKGIALFHYAIDKSGIIFQLSPLDRWFYHSSSGKHDKCTIGIELLHNTGKYTEEQYKALSGLLFDELKLERIVSHDYNANIYSGYRKGCPGPEFDWRTIEREMTNRCINYENLGFECYEML